MRLDGAFNVFCELGQQKFRGIKHRTIGMDQTHFRRVCRMGLIHGGFKDRDVSIVFCNVRFPGTNIIDLDQFKNALEIIATKRKVDVRLLEEYVCGLADKVSKDPHIALDIVHSQQQQQQQNYIKKKIIKNNKVSVEEPIYPTANKTIVNSNKSVDVYKQGQLPIINNHQQMQMQMHPAPVVIEKPKQPESNFKFSLTDFLRGTEQREKASDAIKELNKSLKVNKAEDDVMPANWDVIKGAAGSKVMLKQKPEDWEWAK